MVGTDECHPLQPYTDWYRIVKPLICDLLWSHPALQGTGTPCILNTPGAPISRGNPATFFHHFNHTLPKITLSSHAKTLWDDLVQTRPIKPSQCWQYLAWVLWFWREVLMLLKPPNPVDGKAYIEPEEAWCYSSHLSLLIKYPLVFMDSPCFSTLWRIYFCQPGLA